ncbi:bifunctional adenosylcobinamide kinase/adenosylcobinamide-phosphate guanylyltransferase [Ureibacillus sinduriensis]|uniref:Adenosylcobinamide kinase n=1 Tax=Ureibacillus sinduriensis BLB-1 = JCM 15800 TaxID=1384057 RepID=A0A0A3HQ82_9BACL|nr:bifunctional adenosylcobinamide kinase/adenosylcobinamide-phosphate guanylyltransferase [Ureibacillus sinduriensis]KGR74564.1 hypothetical protein CD33_15830 [Ureibacillus sinduriensis BLB-1 = JCM 15800]
MAKVIFITGGVRSGKSAFAEYYAKQLYQELERSSLYYIASGVAVDEEMEMRIRRHQKDRENSAIKWSTIEIQDDPKLPENISPKQSVILWDCITTWLSNILYITEHLEANARMLEIEKYLVKLKKLFISWKKNDGIILLVSNEILDEPASSYAEANYYRRLLGELHQWIVHYSDEAYEMDYSKVERWK